MGRFSPIERKKNLSFDRIIGRVCVSTNQCASQLNVTTTTFPASQFISNPSVRGSVASNRQSNYEADIADIVIASISVGSVMAMIFASYRVASTKQRPTNAVNILGMQKEKRRRVCKTPALNKLNSRSELLPEDAAGRAHVGPASSSVKTLNKMNSRAELLPDDCAASP
jgi:hypothetical protein